MNSREKGKRGERMWRDQLKAAGYTNSRRGQQFSGDESAPDVICEDLPHLHFEVKYTQRPNIEAALIQAHSDCGSKLPVVASYRTGGKLKEWVVSMPAEAFFKIIQNNANEQ
jgi:hypothetical protein